MFLTKHPENRHLAKFLPKIILCLKNLMFLTKHPENRQLSNILLKIILCLEKPHVSDKAPGKSPIVKHFAQNHFVFGKTTCF